MLKRIYHYLLGYSEYRFPASAHAAVLEHLLVRGIGSLSCTVEGEEGVLLLPRAAAPDFPPGLSCRFVREWGLPERLTALLRRPGLILGGLLGILLLIVSSMTVWRIEIRGNERLGSLEIEEALDAAGLSLGAWGPGVDTAAVRTRVLRDCPDIAWIGIYLRGTTVAVEVRETVLNHETGEAGGLCNLVAAEDGVVEALRVDRGRAVVAPGTTVRRGDLLVSGIYRTAGGVTAVRAEGEVLARTIRHFTVLQPLSVGERDYGEERISALALNFFGKDIKLFKKSGKSTEKYAIIKRKEQVVLFGEIALPIFVHREYRLPYTEELLTLTEEEAVRAAHLRIRGAMAAALTDAELLRKSFSGEWTDEGYLLTCTVECITDIAVPLTYLTE